MTPTLTLRRHRLLATLSLAALAAIHAGEARAGSFRIPAAEPEGFSGLVRENVLVVDVYFGGVQVGETTVVVTPETIRFAEPERVQSLLPPAVEPEKLLRALSRPDFAANAALACTQAADKAQCGRLDTDEVGVILDREKFRIDIFLNPDLLRTQARLADKYLPIAPQNWSLINTIGGIVAGQSAATRSYYNLQDQLVVARGSQRLRADLVLDSDHGFRAEQLLLEWDRPETRLSAGALWTPGDELRGRTKLLGFGVESQIDTRRDRDELIGTPVVVFLDRRSRVDVEYKGRIVSSRIYEAGNRQIDTSSLPDGSYEITLRITPNGGNAREEARFYSKSRRLPSLGRTNFYGFGGLIIDDSEHEAHGLSSAPIFEGGVVHRLGENWALDAQTRLTGDNQSAQLGVTFLSPLVKIHAAGVADSEGTRGTLVNLSSAGSGRFHFSLDFRDISSDLDGAPIQFSLPRGASEDPIDGSQSQQVASRYTQIGGLAAMSVANFRFLSTLYYRDARGAEPQFGVGPAVEWDAFRKGPVVVTFRGDMTVTETGHSGFAGVSLRFVGKRASATALAGVRSSSIEDDSRGSGFSGALSAGWNTAAFGGDLALGAGYERDPREGNLFASAQLDHSAGALSADVVHSVSENAVGGGMQYALGFRSSFVAMDGKGPRIVGKTTTESMIMAQVVGASQDDRFQVLVDEQIAAEIEGERRAFIKLPAYRAYQVRIRPAGKRLVSYDNSSHEVSLLPGTVAQLTWDATPILIKLGQLVDDEGVPVANASIAGPRVWSQTDDNGYFQIEAPEGAVMEVTTTDGRRFALTLPDAPASLAGLVQLDRVKCCDRIQGLEMARSESLKTSTEIGK